MSAIQLAVSVAFGLFVAWLCERWIGLFDNRVEACLIGFILMVVIAYFYDRRQARLRRSNMATTERD